MQEIIVNAPIQTRQNSLNKHERYLSFLSAEAFNRIREFQTGTVIPRVDLWNTIGVKSEKDWVSANKVSPIGYADYHRDQILARYEILEHSYGIKREGRVILTDGDQQFDEVVLEKIRHDIQNGKFEVRNADYYHCLPCDYVIAPKGAVIEKCPVCGKNEMDEVNTRGLFITIDSNRRQQIISDTDIYPETAKSDLKRTVLTISDLIQLSKQRSHGINLTEFGIDSKFVLDPKITLALMGYVVKKLGIAKITTFVQGIDSIGNLAPYVSLVDSEAHYSYVNLGLVPQFDGSTLGERNIDFYKTFLPLMMASFPKGINEQQKLNLYKDFDRTTKQLIFVISTLSQIPESDLSVPSQSPEFPFDKVMNLFNQYNINEGFELLRQSLYEGFSHDYLNGCRTSGTKPNQELLNQIKSLFSLICK